MTANIICRGCAGKSPVNSVDITSTAQPWIWATGPGNTGGNAISSDSQNANINQHNNYGIFFVDMTTTLTDNTTIPTITSKSDINVKPLSSSVPVLIIIHAICLAGSFLLLFPAGIVALRWFNSFRFHWIIQVFAVAACLLGLVIAIAFSAMDPEFASFSEGHQVIGIVAIVCLLGQVVLGYVHHQRYKLVEKRTWVTHGHLWVGRLVIVVGMVNAVLGFSLAGSTPGAIGIAILVFAIIPATLAVVYFGTRRNAKRSSAIPVDSSAPSSIALSVYNTPQRGEENDNGYGNANPHGGYRNEDGPPAYGRGFV